MKIKELTDDELFNYLDSLKIEKCDYCPFNYILYPDGSEYTCPRKVVCYGNEPIFPRCCDNTIDEEYAKKIIIDLYRDEHNEDDLEVLKDE